MKSITSDGGPFVGLDRDFAHQWSGIWGKRFIGNAAIFSNDYEAVCELTNGRGKPPCSISKICGAVTHALIISLSVDTAVIKSTLSSTYIAQVEYCDETWDFSSIQESDFEKADFDKNEEFYFSTNNCTYVFFDAAYSAEKVGDDFISFDLEAGDYVFSSAIYNPDDRTGLILCKITKST